MSENNDEREGSSKDPGVGLLTTYRRSGEPVATPVSIAARAGDLYFVTPVTSGKVRRLSARADVTLAPSTVQGRPTGPTISGKAHPLDEAGRRRVRRLLQPGGPLFWSYLLYRIRGHQMRVYEVRLADPGFDQQPERSEPETEHSTEANPIQRRRPAPTIAQVYRAVRLTARTSALLFAGAQATSAFGSRAAPVSRRLYLAFMAVHAVHFSVVSTYAKVNGGRDLFPGGRSLDQAGGWPTVLSIYTLFSSLALTGWAAGGPLATTHPEIGTIGHAATRVIAAMFVGVYLGQLIRSPWYALPATAVAGAATADILTHRRRRRGLRTEQHHGWTASPG